MLGVAARSFSKCELALILDDCTEDVVLYGMMTLILELC